jgi:hypothetical protein
MLPAEQFTNGASAIDRAVQNQFSRVIYLWIPFLH